MKLKVEKRNQQINTSPRLSPLPPAQIKKETCPTSCSSPALPMLVKQEEAADLGHMSPPDQFIINNQTIKQPETLLSVQAGPQILLPASLPTSAFAIQLPANCIKLNNAVSSAPPGLAQTSGQHPQKTKTPAASQQQSSAHTPPPVEVRKYTPTRPRSASLLVVTIGRGGIRSYDSFKTYKRLLGLEKASPEITNVVIAGRYTLGNMQHVLSDVCLRRPSLPSVVNQLPVWSSVKPEIATETAAPHMFCTFGQTAQQWGFFYEEKGM